MRWVHRLKLRIDRLARRRQLDRDLEDELRFHLEMLAEEHPYPQRRFGNLTSWKESCRDLWTFEWLETWWQDLRYAMRSMRKSPAFTAVAVVTLALGIGANTAIFSVVNGVLLRSLPYPDAGRLVLLWTSTPKDHEDEAPTSLPNFADWRSQSRSFESMSFYSSESAVLTDRSHPLEPEAITSADVTADFFSVLGVSPALGRSFTEGERVVVLSHEFWQRRYGGSPTVLGEPLELNGKDYRVAGVMPRNFSFPSKSVQLWAAASTSEWWKQRYADKRGRGAVVVFGRLKPAFTVGQAQVEMSTITRRLEEQYRATNDDLTARVVPLQAQVLGKTVPILLLVLFGAVVCVLLIACTNVANLLLARGASRQREIALRTALGASRMRILRQMVTESLALSFCGGALGLALAAWAVRLLVDFGPRMIPRLDEIHIDARVMIFTASVSLLSGVCFGLMPAWRDQALQSGSTLKNTGRNTRATGKALVVAEFALAMVLLTGAGLLIRSFLAVRAVDPGFQAQHVVTMELNSRWGDDLHDRAMSRIRTIPGVEFVGAINDIFFAGGGKSLGADTLEVEGHAPEPRDRWRPLVITPNSGDAFQVLGMRLLKGRLFTDRDGERDPLVVIVNEAMARHYWPGEDPVGKRFKGYPGNNKDWVTVVGLMKDIRNRGLEQEAVSQMFAAPRQFKPGAILVIRATEDPERLAAAVRRVVRELDSQAGIGRVSTLEEQLDAQTAERRFQSYLLGLFSALALILAAVGVYGLLHYSVAQRIREIGIRMALGARPRDVIRVVLREGLMLALIGVGLGLAGALAVTRTLASLLFAVSPTDPFTFGAVALLLIAVAVVACYVPARRGTQVDPMIALRCE